MSPRKSAPESASNPNRTRESSTGFTVEERAAMKARADELKAEARRATNKVDGESVVLAKIAEMSETDRAIAERLHRVISANFPALSPKTWYGMPAYTNDGAVLFYFKPGQKFKARYATLGFTDKAHLDHGNMWPTEFALVQLTDAEEARIVALLQQALS